MANEGQTVTYKPGNAMYDSIDLGVEGVEPILQSGTKIPAGKEDEVKEAAKKQNAEIRKVG